MKIIVCGGRDYQDRDLVFQILDMLSPTMVIHGAATGADSLANEWCVEQCVDVYEYPAKWKEHGKAAGPIRNQEMLDNECPELLVAFPGGRGTADMISRAKKAHIPIMLVDQ